MTLPDQSAPEMPFVAIFTLLVKPERRDQFIRAMDRAMNGSALEAGILSFTFVVDQLNPNRFTAVDIFRDRAAYESHLAQPHSRQLLQDLDGCMVGPPSGSFHHRLRGWRDLP